MGSVWRGRGQLNRCGGDSSGNSYVKVDVSYSRCITTVVSGEVGKGFTLESKAPQLEQFFSVLGALEK